MKRTDFYLLLDKVTESAPGTIKGGELLRNINGWDSLATLGLIAALDRQFGVTVPAAHLAEAASVEDLAALVAHKLED